MRLLLALLLVSTLASAAVADECAAGTDMAAARFYVGTAQHVPAINRLKIVLTKYSSAGHAPEALAQIAESFLALGAASEAQTAAAVLDRKFSGTRWSVQARALLASAALVPRENERSWISQAFR